MQVTEIALGVGEVAVRLIPSFLVDATQHLETSHFPSQ
jgi:hypothetical protein